MNTPMDSLREAKADVDFVRNQRDAYAEGARAATDGKSETDNPYNPHSFEEGADWKDWNEGFRALATDE